MMAKIAGIYEESFEEAHEHAVGQRGVLAKDAKKHKAEFIPRGKIKVVASEIGLPEEYAEALRKLYPGLKLSKAIRKHVILTIKLSTLETRVIKAPK